jgi:chemotaxis protein MotB
VAESPQRPLVIRNKKRKPGGHHGGAWKIAYADFVTAMMAFFLLMWLLGSTTKGDLQGIAEYFRNPLKPSLSGGSGAGESPALIKLGGGQDLVRVEGQRARSEEPAGKRPPTPRATLEEQRLDLARLRELKSRIEAVIEASAALRPFRRQLLLDITEEGLRIQIVDEENRPMFALGSAELQPYMRQILRELAQVLNEVPNRVSIAGHTDAKPYAGGERGYSNWELSADRANASRRELIAGGIQEGKIARVVGLGASVPFNRADPEHPMNRRISLVVLTRKAEAALLQEAAPRSEASQAEPDAAPR